MARYFIRSSKVHLAAFAPDMALLRSAYQSRIDEKITIADLDPAHVANLRDSGMELIRSTQYEPLATHDVQVALPNHPLNMRDVMTHNQAAAAWAESRGQGVHIAVVDTGVCGTMSEFPAAKRSALHWANPGEDPWTDIQGHGSMTMAIAAGTSAAGGRYDGVAPDASIIPCKTSFDDTELYQIYDYLIQLVDTQQVKRLVVNNSYGAYVCAPQTISRTDPFPSIVSLAIQKGIVVVFAAGNNHVVQCSNDPTKCEPNTIWGVNSFDEVITVGTVDANNRMDQPPLTPAGYSHRDSSRGPGQFAVAEKKPNCVAPTYGEVIWGCGYRAMEWWGTSGAAPQVTGLAALMLARNPALTPAQIKALIEQTCVSLPLARTCVGAGLINCAAAVAAA
jgi:serine protease AprX